MSKLKEWDKCPYCKSESIDIVTFGAELQECACRLCNSYEDKDIDCVVGGFGPSVFNKQATRERYECVEDIKS